MVVGNNDWNIRLLDVLISIPALIVFVGSMPVFLVLGAFYFDRPFFIQVRAGLNKEPFKLKKYRTLAVSTPSVPTHLLKYENVDSGWYSKFLRRTKIDELPQVLNVLNGSMSWVGPRPCLPIQSELIALRSKAGLYRLRPGVTGIPQLTGLNMANPQALVAKERECFSEFSLLEYIRTLSYQALVILRLV